MFTKLESPSKQINLIPRDDAHSKRKPVKVGGVFVRSFRVSVTL